MGQRDPNLHRLVKELLLDDDVKDLVHEGALLDTGVLFQREVDVKDTGHHREAHEQDGYPFLDVTTLKKSSGGESSLNRQSPTLWLIT